MITKKKDVVGEMLSISRLNRTVTIFKNTSNRSITLTSAEHRLTPSKAVSSSSKFPKRTSSSKMQRKWQPDLSKLETHDAAKSTYRHYKLLSYNILAQDLLVEHLHLYYDIDNRLLRWDNRLNKLKEEVAQLQPDIICLQEMQYDHLKDLVDQFSIVTCGDGKGERRKLEYIFKKKTGTRSDGCAIIYDRNKFKLISEHFVEYYTDGVATLNRENIAIMGNFEILDDPLATQFVVATTHLLYNPRREDVRISQVNKLVQAVIDFSRSATDSHGNNCQLPVLLTGDFNFTPNTRAFEILTALRRPVSSTVWSQEEPNKEDFFQMEPIDFGRDGASTYQNQWVIVDYILSSRPMGKNEKSIQVKSTYQLPTVDTCWKHGKIPSRFVGSDHFSLAIQFSIT